uniref:Uncharacterized protein n=1 Tax=Neovison vison TaxID=452646 RepID=A0A8C7BZ01_NEOVI
MGNIFSNLFKGFFGKKEMRMHSHGGLGCCRRTTIPYKQKLGEIVATVPTVEKMKEDGIGRETNHKRLNLKKQTEGCWGLGRERVVGI